MQQSILRMLVKCNIPVQDQSKSILRFSKYVLSACEKRASWEGFKF